MSEQRNDQAAAQDRSAEGGWAAEERGADSSGVGAPSAARSRPLRPFRRLHGLCLYCGRPVAGDVCRYCSDLPVRDPLVSKARLPLSEAERIAAR